MPGRPAGYHPGHPLGRIGVPEEITADGGWTSGQAMMTQRLDTTDETTSDPRVQVNHL